MSQIWTAHIWIEKMVYGERYPGLITGKVPSRERLWLMARICTSAVRSCWWRVC